MVNLPLLEHKLFLAVLSFNLLLASACLPTKKHSTEEASETSGVVSGKQYSTFATTFAPNPRYACGYMKNMVDSLTKDDNKYFVAISANNFNSGNCGRLIDITIRSQCGNGSRIDEGYCESGEKAKVSKVQAILVDRCADAKKCMPPSQENAELKHDVNVHLDIGPQQKAIANIGSQANYDISWQFSSDTYAPIAYLVFGSGYADYVRIGLITSRGVKSIKVNDSVWNANSSQAEFAGILYGARKALSDGIIIQVQHTDGSRKSYMLKSDFKKSEVSGAETIYEATIN